MPGAGERAYVYARACGIIGKSFIGKGLAKLEGLTRLSELDRLIFAAEARNLPEKELLPDFERRVMDRSAAQIVAIVDFFRKPPKLLVLMAREFEYADLKRAIAAAAAGEKTAPAVTGIGRFATVDFAAYPRFDKMLGGTEFEFLLDDLNDLSGGSIALVQHKLDRHYYEALWKSLFKLAPRDRVSIGRILAAELSLRNAAWALRVRSYYGMEADQARDYLIPLPSSGRYAVVRRKAPFAKPAPTLADDALASLNLALDNPAEWTRWRWAKFLNRSVPGETWAVDPQFFQNAAARYLYHLTRHSFSRRPFSLDTSACFIKLKLFEEDLLVSLAEGISLGMGSREILGLMGVAS
jgi:vacuolar-type H+-ATPase subunit C/Vma6